MIGYRKIFFLFSAHVIVISDLDTLIDEFHHWEILA